MDIQQKLNGKRTLTVNIQEIDFHFCECMSVSTAALSAGILHVSS